MAINFAGPQTTDNYSTVFVPKLQEGQKGLACWLDPAIISYIGTPYTGSYRVNSGSGGSVERYNGSAWVAQAIQGISYNGGNPQIAGSNILKASDATDTATASKLALRTSSGYLFATYFNQGSSSVENPPVGSVFVENSGDGYLRKASISFFANQLAAQNVSATGTWFHGSSNGVGVGGQSGSLAAYNAAGTGAATMSFLRNGVYGINFGLDSDNMVRMGGWSDGLNTYRFAVNSVGNFYATSFHPGFGSNYMRSVTGSYGTVEMNGSNGGYTGVSFHATAAGSVAGMFDTSGNGGDYDNSTGWHFYWHRATQCLALGGSSVTSGYKAQTNGSHYVQGVLHATGVLRGNGGAKGFGAVTITSATAAPSGGSDGDFHMIF